MYYQEARKHDKAIYQTMVRHRKGFQAHQEKVRKANAMRDPLQSLMVEGRACKLIRQGPQVGRVGGWVGG